MENKRILFFKLGALGDVLMSTPLVRQVRKNYPNAKMDYLVGKSASSVLKNNPYLDNVSSFNQDIFIKKNLSEFNSLIKTIKEKKYDLIFVLDKHWIFNLTAWLFGIKKRIGFNRGQEGIFLSKKIKYKKVRHEINYYLDLGKIFGLKIDYSDNKIDIFPSKGEIDKAEGIIKENKLNNFYVLINSGGNNPAVEEQIRKIPDSVFKELVKKLSIKNNVIFLAAPNEKDYYNNFVLNKNCIDLSGKTNIQESYCIMKKAKMIITTDCGPMHMASSANDKIISIFGPTNPARKAPLRKNAKAVWNNSDKKIYQEKYELYGKLPKCVFFKDLKKEDIIDEI